ncbi:GPI anchored serine-threonine rich family protein [Aspergillus undulatus]|uniref:GPI anchored serine-threonine rich family protein n=1 Tax=Aspergillus undulatus TaxID=1810928 RepID=UPI003CCD611B
MHLISSLSLFLAFALSALALKITSPGTTNQRVDFSKPFTIKWTTVPSDPENFTITLVNSNGHNVNKDLVKDIDSSEEEYRVESVSGIPTGNNYQINFRSTERNNMGILAQSPRFNVTRAAAREEENDDDDSSSSTATSTSSGAEATETDENGAARMSQGVLSASVVAGLIGLAVLGL